MMIFCTSVAAGHLTGKVKSEIFVSTKKKEILDTALTIIREQGYAALSMRNLAKRCDITLSSLQYHFANWKTLIDGISAHLLNAYQLQWEALHDSFDDIPLPLFIEFVIDDLQNPDTAALWPQFWAMAKVEPAVEAMLAQVYQPYLGYLRTQFIALGCEAADDEALALISMLEGMLLFIAHGQQHSDHHARVKQLVLDNLYQRFPALRD